MEWKKSGVGAFLLSLAAFLASCTPTGAFPSLMDIWLKILWFATLGWLGYYQEGPMVGFMRILVVILVFAILYELATLTGFLSRNIAITIALILALMSGIFIPGSVFAGIGAAYATIVSLFLIGVPVLGGLYAFMRIPTTSRVYRFFRIVILLVLLMVLIAVKSHASDLLAVGSASVASVIIPPP